MGLGIEDDLVEVQRPGRREQKVEILESFCEDKALHRVGLFPGNNALQRGIACFGPAVPDEITKKPLAHLQIKIRVMQSTLRG